jgi:hypothetical protein
LNWKAASRASTAAGLGQVALADETISRARRTCPVRFETAPSALENEAVQGAYFHSTLDSMGRNHRLVRFVLALALAIVGALGAIYVLFFAAGGHYITAVASVICLGVGLIWLSDFVDAPSP